MPNNTANFNLPYPSGSDAPCDFDEQWCDFTAAIDSVFGTWQTTIDRTVPVIPIAKLRQGATITVPGGNQIPFNEVTVDTAGMTNIDADPYTIVIPQTGRYTLSASIRKTTSTIVNSEMNLQIQTSLDGIGGTTIVSEVLDRGAGISYRIPAFWPVVSLAANTKVVLVCAIGSSANMTIEGAWLAVAWHSDTEVP